MSRRVAHRANGFLPVLRSVMGAVPTAARHHARHVTATRSTSRTSRTKIASVRHVTPTTLRGRAEHYGRIAAFAVEHPRQASELWRWWHDRHRPPIESRMPWWPYRAIDAVQRALPPNASVLEFGGGGSTLWLHDLGADVTCVEHDPDWLERLQKALPADVRLVLREPQATGSIQSARPQDSYFDEYVAVACDIPDGSLDLVIIDGRARVACGMAAALKVKPGGLLLLDDSTRPDYAGLLEHLAGWTRTDYFGLKMGGGLPRQTSFWRRPEIG
jgi:hypothetical protein